MKILFAIKSLNNAHGGAERVFSDVTRGLYERGHDISVLTFDGINGESFFPLHENIPRLDLAIGDTAQEATFFETIKRMIALRRAVKKQNPDAVVAFMHSMFVPLAFALIGTGIPVMASEHIVPDHYKTRPLEYFMFKCAVPFISKITVISQAIKSSYPAFMHSKMVVVSNPVVLPKVTKKPTPSKTKTILNVGRLDEQKDQATLIKAFAGLADDFPYWRVRICGEGHLRPALESLIVEHNLQDRVQLTGIIKDIHSEYGQADIFAMCSSYESFGLVTIEAMAHSVPIVGFADCPGTNEIITDGENGLLVDSTDRVESYKNGLRRLMGDNHLRAQIGQAGKQSAQTYSAGAIYDAWETLLQDAA